MNYNVLALESNIEERFRIGANLKLESEVFVSGIPRPPTILMIH